MSKGTKRESGKHEDQSDAKSDASGTGTGAGEAVSRNPATAMQDFAESAARPRPGVMFSVAQVASLCHQVNREYCMALGDYSQETWDGAADWQRQSMLAGVEFRIKNPHAQPSASHESWLKMKLEDGWKYGPKKDPEKKEHPCCVPWEELAPEQRVKDYLSASIVMSLLTMGMITGHERDLA